MHAPNWLDDQHLAAWATGGDITALARAIAWECVDPDAPGPAEPDISHIEERIRRVAKSLR